MKTYESTDQLQKRLIRFTKLFPMDQKIEPGKQLFDDPSSRHFTGFQAVCNVFWLRILFVVLRIEPNMRLVATIIQFSIDGNMIMGCIQAQILRSSDSRLRAIKAQGIKSREQQFALMAIGSLNDQGQWKSTTIAQYTPFGSLFAAISGSGTHGGLSERGFGCRTVHALPVPSNTNQFIVMLQLSLSQTLEEALRFPYVKVIIDVARCSQLTRQCIPLDASVQNIDDSGKHLSIISGESSSFRMRGYQRTYLLPQFIAHFPQSCSCHSSCSPDYVFVFTVSLVLG